MKKNKLLEWTFIALATITSCTNDTEEIYTQENEIKLTSEITPSRVTSLDYQSTQIVKDQQVGVTITGAKSEHKNVAWNVGEEGELSNTGGSIFWANEDIAITAYHPYNSSWIGTSHEFSVSTDQSTEENYRNSDLLWATETSSKTETAIPLIFSHKLAKINVTLKSEDIEDLSGATISICGTNISTNFNPVDGTLSATTANIQEIKAGVTSSTAYTASAIVVPQTVANGTKLIKITHNDRTFYYTLSTNKELKSGCSHNYTLTIKEKEVTTESDKITDWEDDDNIGDAEEIETIPNNQIWYTSTYGKISPDSDAFGVAITSNVYQDGEGIITFDGDVRKIGDDAFIAQDRLASITLPNSVKSIGREAFASCTSLTSIIMSKNITTIEREAFEECSSLTSISIPNGVTQIEFETFRDCSSLTSVTIPNSVISVGGSSFYNCTSLTSVNIPNSVTSIYGTTFHGCASLKSIVVEQGNPIYDSRENCNAIIETETNKLISGCNNTSIPSSVTSISQQAFSGRTSLTSILVPNSVTSIEFLAFADCTSLASITIGSGVTDIATKAFLGCTSLSTVDITATIPPQIYNETFTNCSSNLKIYVPAGSLEAYKAAEYWKDLNIIEEGSKIIAVDLGLSVKWANCNIGASNPHEYGDYFAWGEIYTKDSFSEANYAYYNSTATSSSGKWNFIGRNICGTDYDAAKHILGDGWAMPTYLQMQELIDKCTWTWTTCNDVAGFEIKSNINNNTIFLPAAGFNGNSSSVGYASWCWTGVMYENGTYYGWGYHLNATTNGIQIEGRMRSYGMPIRPVYNE